MRPWTLTAILALALLAAVAASTQPATDDQPALPDTPTARRAAAFLTAFNSDEKGAMERFFAESSSPEASQRRPPARRAMMISQIRADQGTFTLRRVEKVAPDEVIVLVEGSSGHFVRLTFGFGAEPDCYLEGIGFEMVDPDDPAPAELPPMSLEQALTAARAAVDEAVAADEFSGTVLIAREGKPVFLDAWGLASQEHCVANRPDTAFNLGSINKMFTKVAIGQLVVAGTLSLDDSLGKWLPDFSNADARAKVTVRHLVEMRSGIGDFFGERFDATPKNSFRHNREYLRTFADLPLQFEPGSQRRYSNGGYVTLGEIITAASGQDYYDHVRDHVFAPAGMTRTASWEADQVVPKVAEGYTRLWDGSEHPGEPRRRNLYSRPARGSSAGGGYSTAEDLLRFVNVLLADTLLPPAWTEWVLGGAEPTGNGAGEFPHDRGGSGFAGGAPGINSVIEVDLETRTTIVVMSNFDPPAANRIAQRLRPIMGAVAEKPAAP